MGWSSAGHLATLLGTCQDGLPGSNVSARVAAVVDLSGPGDMAKFAVDPSAGGGLRPFN